MTFDFSQLNWLAVFVSFVAGQVFLTLWFTAIFGEPWAKAYQPGKTRAEHTKEVPGYTYGVGAACTLLVVLTVGLLQGALGVHSIGSGLTLGVWISLGLVAATMIPGYAFLRRWDALWLSLGSQVMVVLLVSAILGAWR